MTIENTQACFVLLWQELEHTREQFLMQHRRFCIRNIIPRLQERFAPAETLRRSEEGVPRGMLLFEVSLLSQVEGYEELPPPAYYPLKHREMLRAWVAVNLGIGMRAVNLRALDKAYSVAFPRSTPINKSKKARSQV